MVVILNFSDYNLKRAVDACLAGSQKLSKSKITDLKEAKEKFMKNITVEGAQLALEIGPKILQDLNSKHFPLMFSMLNTICENKKLEIKW